VVVKILCCGFCDFWWGNGLAGSVVLPARWWNTLIIIIIIIIIFNYAVAAPVRVYIAGLYRCIIYIRGEPYEAG
jgi:hypothetical protein